jgi:polyribonucleotide nucleotidyltransferase
MDIKITGISLDIMRDALAQAREGRLHIIGAMDAAIPQPRAEMSPYAPRLTTIMIPVDMIGAVIGPGGKNIRQIVKDSGAEIDIQDDGSVTIAATTSESADKAIAAIQRITEVPEIGKVYTSTVKKVMEFGAFVEFLPGKEGLVHVSQLDTKRVEKPSDIVKVGDVFDVKIIDKDDQGRWKLSRKVLLQPPAEGEQGEGGERKEHGRDHSHGGHHRDHHKKSPH